MITISESAVIHRPVEEVFDAAADPQTQLEWDPGTLRSVENLTPGPLGLGSRYRGDFKGSGVVEYEYVEFDRPRRFAHRADVKIGRIRHVFTFEPVPEGTRLTQEAHLRRNFLGRLMGPLGTRFVRKRFRQIASELETYLSRK